MTKRAFGRPDPFKKLIETGELVVEARTLSIGFREIGSIGIKLALMQQLTPDRAREIARQLIAAADAVSPSP